jgi:hypothetical protein
MTIVYTIITLGLNRIINNFKYQIHLKLIDKNIVRKFPINYHCYLNEYNYKLGHLNAV